MPTLKSVRSYARYLLTALSTVAFRSAYLRERIATTTFGSLRRVAIGAILVAIAAVAGPGPGVARVEAACAVGQVCGAVPTPKPDLVIAVTVLPNGTPRVTVTNVGTARAGAFAVAGTGTTGASRQWSSPGLAPGASQTFGGDHPADLLRIAHCGVTWTVTADAGKAVPESGKTNNTATAANSPCS